MSMQHTGDGPPGGDDYYDLEDMETKGPPEAAATPMRLPGTQRRWSCIG